MKDEKEEDADGFVLREGLGCDCFSVVYYGAASMRLFMRLRLNA